MYGSNNNKQKKAKFKYNSVSILVIYSAFSYQNGRQSQKILTVAWKVPGSKPNYYMNVEIVKLNIFFFLGQIFLFPKTIFLHVLGVLVYVSVDFK